MIVTVTAEETRDMDVGIIGRRHMLATAFDYD